MSAVTPSFGPVALIVPRAHRQHRWSYRFGVQQQQRGEPRRTDFGVWEPGDVAAYQAGYHDAETDTVQRKGEMA